MMTIRFWIGKREFWKLSKDPKKHQQYIDTCERLSGKKSFFLTLEIADFKSIHEEILKMKMSVKKLELLSFLDEFSVGDEKLFYDGQNPISYRDVVYPTLGVSISPVSLQKK